MSWVDKNEWFMDRSREPIRWAALRRFLGYYRPDVKLITAAGVSSVFGSCVIAFIPYSLRSIQKAVEANHRTQLFGAVGVFLAILITQNAVAWTTRKIRARIASSLNSTLLLAYFSKVLNIPTEDFIIFRATGNMFQRIIDALSVTTAVTESLIQAIQAVVTTVILIAILFGLAPTVALTVGLGCAVLFFTAKSNATKLQLARKKVLSINYPLVGKMIETIDAALVIKTLAASFHVTSDIAELVMDKQSADYHEISMEARSTSLNALVGSFVTACALLLTSIGLMRGTLTLPQTLAVYVLVGLCVGPVVELANLFQGLPSLSLTVHNYLQTLDLPDDNPDANLETECRPNALEPPHVRPTPAALGNLLPYRGQAGMNAGPTRAISHGRQTEQSSRNGSALVAEIDERRLGDVQLSDVTFSYRGGSPVLQDLNLHIYPGEHIGLVGRSGSGKTTLFRLLLGLLHPQQGSITVSDTNPSYCCSKENYRKQFGVVSQNDFLFNASVLENLVFGVPFDDHTHLDIEGTLAAVNLWDRMKQLPNGLDSKYLPDTFSGGEKQRLLVARALLRDPCVVLLDEPTSALDFENEGLVLEAVQRLTAGRTTITIAHRLSTVKAADRIIVLENGLITGNGKHDELLATSEYYRNLYNYNAFIV